MDTTTALILDHLRDALAQATAFSTITPRTSDVAQAAGFKSRRAALEALKALELEGLVQSIRPKGRGRFWWEITKAGLEALEAGDTAADVATFHPCSVLVVNAYTGRVEWEAGAVLELEVAAADLNLELEDTLWANGWDPSDPSLPVVCLESLAAAAERIGDHRLELKVLEVLRSIGAGPGHTVLERRPGIGPLDHAGRTVQP